MPCFMGAMSVYTWVSATDLDANDLTREYHSRSADDTDTHDCDCDNFPFVERGDECTTIRYTINGEHEQLAESLHTVLGALARGRRNPSVLFVHACC